VREEESLQVGRFERRKRKDGIESGKWEVYSFFRWVDFADGICIMGVMAGQKSVRRFPLSL
jgi:hypothetical protein